MNKNMLTAFISLFFLQTANAQQNTDVRVAGAMKDVMWKGQLHGTVYLDTITDKTNLYGIGPVEYLSGELMIVDGKSYKSKVVSDTVMEVEETFNVKAPFFVYSNTGDWKEYKLPKKITTGRQLEAYLIKLNQNADKPFTFKLVGSIDSASIHIVNLPKGSVVASPDDAHKGQVNYKLNKENVIIVGFFSTQHKAIFTHHDTFIHMHLITDDKSKMGHIDGINLKRGGMKLYISN
ncbi:acetolactate decarboxylase [Flavobacterium arsenatis]|uniref:Alpha-acetolactate decarboxylase n=1 Tax=Flavobacterium arsenatis TaxID=1484332 RepID=A0ABU1TMU8_9FLAO|nr:acetolactate decarboxylase [Flavobacterium arsenatis]MDR6967291.1 acetolactate decarboxylase [Flavobacterium arsenatis]